MKGTGDEWKRREEWTLRKGKDGNEARTCDACRGRDLMIVHEHLCRKNIMGSIVLTETDCGYEAVVVSSRRRVSLRAASVCHGLLDVPKCCSRVGPVTFVRAKSVIL